MKFIDVHTHLVPPPDVMAIRNLMNPDSVKTSLEEDGLFSVGLHPWHLHPDYWQDDMKVIREFIHHPKVVAIGEAGLDRLTDLPLSLQTEVFTEMVSLSEEARKPLIIHAVRTHAEIALLHKSLKPKQAWIIHGFNVRMNIALGLIQQGIYLSFGAALLDEHSQACAVLQAIPEDLFFLESDDKAVSMLEIYNRAAMIRNTSVESLKKSLMNRFEKLFQHG